MALLPAAVLIGDPDRQWLSTAVPLVLQQDLATSAIVAATFVPDASTAYQLQSEEALRSTIELRNQRLILKAGITSLRTQQNVEVLEQDGPEQAGVIPLLDALARKIDASRASKFSTHNNESLRLFVAAVNAADLPTRTRLLDSAIQTDPRFGLAQIARLDNVPTAPTHSVPAAEFTAYDHARWRVIVARASHAPFTDQLKAQAAVVNIAPNNIDALATLGLEQFFAGHGAEGERLLRRAISLSPANPALPIQLAQGMVAARRFSEAERILAPLSSSNINLLLPLALVQLLNGNRVAAESTFNRFVSFMPAGNQALPALQSQWERFLNPVGLGAPAEPAAFWQNVVQQSGEMNLAARAMYAAALEHAGDTADLRNVHVLPFIPEFADPNAPVAFNEMRRLNGLLSGK